jgi:hypothetical protein
LGTLFISHAFFAAGIKKLLCIINGVSKAVQGGRYYATGNWNSPTVQPIRPSLPIDDVGCLLSVAPMSNDRTIANKNPINREIPKTVSPERLTIPGMLNSIRTKVVEPMIRRGTNGF